MATGTARTVAREARQRVVRGTRAFRRIEEAGIAWAERRPRPTSLAPPTSDSPTATGDGDVRIPTYVIHWNAAEWCAATVASLLASEGVDTRPVVIDNSSSSELADLLPPGTTVQRNPVNIGFTGAANQGLRQWLTTSDSPFCLITSHDARLGPRTLGAMVHALETHPLVGIVGPLGGARDPVDPPADRAIALEPRRYVTGSTFLVRRECARSVGEFDERFRSYVEDVDYCYRAWDAGWQVVALSDARVGMNGSRSPNSWALTRANSVFLARKRRGLIGASVRLLLLAYSSTSYSVSGIVRSGTTGARARKRGRQERMAILAAVRRLAQGEHPEGTP